MIRTAETSDLPQLAKLFDLYRQFYKQESNLTLAENFLKERMSNNESIIFVAVSESNFDQLVGFVQLYPTFTSVGAKRAWILNDLYVDEGHRKTGHGEALLKAAVEFSAKSGARNLMLQTAVTNSTAQKLYERLGWVKNDKYYSYYFFH